MHLKGCGESGAKLGRRHYKMRLGKLLLTFLVNVFLTGALLENVVGSTEKFNEGDTHLIEIVFVQLLLLKSEIYSVLNEKYEIKCVCKGHVMSRYFVDHSQV